MCGRDAFVRHWIPLALAVSAFACSFPEPIDVPDVDAPVEIDGAIDMADIDAGPDSMIDAEPDAMLDPAELFTAQQAHDFGDVTTGQSSALLSVVVRNVGDLDTGTLAVALDGDAPGEFAIVPTGDASDCAGATLSAEETCTAQVRYRPTTAGDAAATLRVSSTPGGMVEVPVTGTGLEPGDVVITAGADLDFGTVEIESQSATQTITVQNDGGTSTANLTVTVSDTTNYTKLSDTCDGAPLGPAATCEIGIRFNPTIVAEDLGASISIRESPTSGVSAAATGHGSARLSVSKTGTGTITSTPTGISCGTSCTGPAVASFTNTPVVLTATAPAGWAFEGWGGACASAGSLTMCSVALDQPLTSVSAAFTQVFTLTVATTGEGVVTADPPGINCGNANSDCMETYDTGTMVTLTADPDVGSEVYAWTGAACAQGQRTCTVTMNQARTVGVEFRRQYTLSVSTSGSGSVTGGGINCPGTCSATVWDGTTVTLTETPGTAATGSQNVFTGWGGSCSAAGTMTTCALMVDGDETVSAGFQLQHRVRVTMAGAGSGTVAGPSGFSCTAGTCDRYYNSGTSVTLTATPGATSLFDGFSGDCTGATCTGSLTAPRTVTATFLQGYTMTVNLTGNGTVTAPGINCGTDCEELYAANAPITLTAAPASGHGVYAWTGSGVSCTQGSTSCVVTMSAARTVGVEFRPQYTLTVSAPTGNGTVTGTGINCPGDCTHTVFQTTPATTIQLTANPAAAGSGSRNINDGWSGACSSAGTNATCTVTMDQNRTAGVAFQLQHQLGVDFTGSGAGSVTSNPAGLSCTGDCSAWFDAGTGVSLAAMPGGTSFFDGFGGDCSGASCAVTMSAPRSVTAAFSGGYVLTVNVTGNGEVTATGLDCPGDCSELYPAGSMVTLTAAPGAGNGVYAWTGTAPATCAQGATMCTVSMSAARTVGVEFRPQYTLTVSAPTGNGTVTGTGINCPGDCTHTVFQTSPATTIQLTANPAAAGNGSRNIITGWSGACSGSGTSTTCTVTMDANRTAGVAFQLQHQLSLTFAGTGSGSVMSNPAGLSCTSNCNAWFNSGTNVALTATPSMSQFNGFSSPCASGTCNMTGPVSTTASFTAWECTPSTTVCDDGAVVVCDATGQITSTESCLLGCDPTPAAHCAYIEPVYLSTVCDAPAASASLAISGSQSVSTNTDTFCNGGIITQTNGPAICLVRYGTISIASGVTFTVTGNRALALVADGNLSIAGTLDVSANGATNGPGGGTVSSGGAASTNGGGGAGFKQSGGHGANGTTNGGTNNGGASYDPLTSAALVGGRRSPAVGFPNVGADGGGGGGAVTLISCKGTVSVAQSGLIDAGGGGGEGGFDFFAGQQLELYGAAGGGSGGYVVFQGAAVDLRGAFYSNGGGGGAGGTNDSSGQAGQDGTRSTTVSAAGGSAVSPAGSGGRGGRGTLVPGDGFTDTGQGSPGGGGGSTGRFQVYTPVGASTVVTPSAASPTFESNRTVPVK